MQEDIEGLREQVLLDIERKHENIVAKLFMRRTSEQAQAVIVRIFEDTFDFLSQFHRYIPDGARESFEAMNEDLIEPRAKYYRSLLKDWIDDFFRYAARPESEYQDMGHTWESYVQFALGWPTNSKEAKTFHRIFKELSGIEKKAYVLSAFAVNIRKSIYLVDRTGWIDPGSIDKEWYVIKVGFQVDYRKYHRETSKMIERYSVARGWE